ncbi:hypothetical protein SAMN05216282_11149 [Cryobacterium psychrotolerans]|uniref:Uncharacterized protein n=1 Tax=Cryobacterium psychrotolerans TaxID=386301 RepID=A0A1G9E6M5_9MICO|nr:hypothetical protein [Cryobacterium psychrotolerans]TFD86403.1 hypothetical protein E3T56_07415 [Cryobacterium psychrotolerans]SDK71753.1 hypothetical protein SAMN05216282_11149 [Cryobacterium psychrotolerans]
MGRPIDGGDAYENAILRPERNVAPRLQAGWAALAALLSDGLEHTREECYDAILDTGLAEKTATNLIRMATRLEVVVPRRARVERGVVNGRVLAVSLYVGFRLAETVLPAVTRDP